MPELLSPVQDWKTLENIYEIVDSIYFGVKSFSMRAQANNFKASELSDLIKYCHARNPPIKAYLATNILIYDSELKDLEQLLDIAKESEVDAVIANDIATMKFARKKGINFHVSTQCNISNIESAKFYEDFGAERIVLARELSLNQIKLIKHHLNHSKVECFVHGSMCTSISGRCYFSATISNSEEYSANRGNCIQPCRRIWKVIDDENNEFIYDGEMFLNAKDLCMIEYIPELIEANIDAFKIEGRMKNPLYVKTVTQCYKEAIESYFNGTFTDEKLKSWKEELSKVYNRGYHTGFYFQKPGLNEIERSTRGNVSPYKKTYIGKVLSFDKRSKTANVLLENLDIPLQIGDEIIIIGKNSYQIEKIKKMMFKGEKIKSIARKRYTDPVKINLRIENCESGDKIYILLKE
jgi:U32 family peptidase